MIICDACRKEMPKQQHVGLTSFNEGMQADDSIPWPGDVEPVAYDLCTDCCAALQYEVAEFVARRDE